MLVVPFEPEAPFVPHFVSSFEGAGAWGAVAASEGISRSSSIVRWTCGTSPGISMLASMKVRAPWNSLGSEPPSGASSGSIFATSDAVSEPSGTSRPRSRNVFCGISMFT